MATDRDIPGSSVTAYSDASNCAVKHDIEDALDEALRFNQALFKEGKSGFRNVLLSGETGVGKTERVRSWAKGKDINLVDFDCTQLGAVKSFYDDRFADDINAAQRARETLNPFTAFFDSLDKPNSVLFLDNYAWVRPEIRRGILSLIRDHVLIAPNGTERRYENLLFTIAAYIPQGEVHPTLYGLEPDEEEAFRTIKVVADKRCVLEYLEKELTGILQTRKESNDEEYYKVTLGELNIARHILKDERFEFDSEEEILEKWKHNRHDQILTPRGFESALEGSDGTKEGFLEEWSGWCNPSKKALVELILKDYIDPF